MGWAKYAEDNCETIYERFSMRGGYVIPPTPTYGATLNTKTETAQKSESSFAETLRGESCFSI